MVGGGALVQEEHPGGMWRCWELSWGWIWDQESLLPCLQPSKQKRKFSSFFKSLVIELDKELYGPDNHLVEVRWEWILVGNGGIFPSGCPAGHAQSRFLGHSMGTTLSCFPSSSLGLHFLPWQSSALTPHTPGPQPELELCCLGTALPPSLAQMGPHVGADPTGGSAQCCVGRRICPPACP